jgi:tyrosyl-tRNA synthetase
MQALDEHYLGVDIQIGGTDQRKIMVLARENLPKLGYKSRIELMFPLLPGLIGSKMSSSDVNSKIDLFDDEGTIKSKLNSAEMVAGNPNNGVMAFLKNILMVIKQDKNQELIIERPEKYGGNLKYKNYEEIEKDFIEKKIHPLDLKMAIAKEIFNMLKPIQSKRKEIEKLYKEAYGK